MKCPSPTWLLDFRRDGHSQPGEDGIIGKILAILPDGDKWCVEFGALDGLYLTNTRHLISSKGYELVCVLPWNAFFVKKQYYPLFKMETNDPQVLHTDLSGITDLFVGCDGKVLLRGACKLPSSNKI